MKTEGCFHGTRNADPADDHILVCGIHVDVKLTMRYLGLVLIRRKNFCANFERLSPREVKAVAALGRLLTNVGGSNEFHHPLYGAPA